MAVECCNNTMMKILQQLSVAALGGALVMTAAWEGQNMRAYQLTRMIYADIPR